MSYGSHNDSRPRGHRYDQAYEERRENRGHGARDRSRSPVRGQPRWEGADPYGQGRTTSGATQMYSHAPEQRWEHVKDVQEQQHGYAQSYAYTAPAYQPAHPAVGLPYDAPYAEYQDPRSHEAYSTRGKGNPNPPSRDVIFLGLEPTYTEQAVRPFIESCPSFLIGVADARVSSDAVWSASRQDDDRA